MPETFKSTLDCLDGQIGGAEAAEVQRLLMDMVSGLEWRHLTGKTLVPMFIPGPNSHWELIAIKATGPTHELAVIGPLGSNRERTRLPQASGLRCGVKANTKDLTQLHIKKNKTRCLFNPEASLVVHPFE